MNQDVIRQTLDEMIARCEDNYARYMWARQEATMADLTVLFGNYAEQYALAATEFRQGSSIYLNGNGQHYEPTRIILERVNIGAEQSHPLDNLTGIRNKQLLTACIQGEELMRKCCTALAELELPAQLAAHIREQDQKACAALTVLCAQQSLPWHYQDIVAPQPVLMTGSTIS
jgi:hypothetical protein